MRKNKSLKVGLGLLGLTILFYVLPRVFRTSIIVGSGVMMANALALAYILPLMVAVPILVMSFFLVYKQVKSAMAEGKLRKARLSYRSKKLRPEDVSAHLTELKSRHPSLATQFDKCLGQMDSIKKRQASLDEMIRLTEADLLADAPSALVEAEQSILRNLMWVINRGIVSVTDGNPDTEDDDVELDRLINKVLVANEQVIEKCRELTRNASDLASSRGSDSSSIVLVESLVAAIRQQVKHSAFGEED
jgi:hypothetical protein